MKKLLWSYLFGYPNKVILEKELTFNKNNTAGTGEFALLRRIWAEKKIAQLQREGAQAKNIDAVGRQYGIVTEGNSLIVLETVADYVRYQITPPKELQREYEHLVNKEKQDKEKEKKEHLDYVVKLSEAQSNGGILPSLSQVPNLSRIQQNALPTRVPLV